MVRWRNDELRELLVEEPISDRGLARFLARWTDAKHDSIRLCALQTTTYYVR